MTRNIQRYKKLKWIDELLFDSRDIAYKFILFTLNKFCENNDYSIQGFLAKKFANKTMASNFMNFIRTNQVPSPHYYRKLGLYTDEVCDWLEWHKVNMPYYKVAGVRNDEVVALCKKWKGADEPPFPEIIAEYSEIDIDDFEIEDLEEEDKKGKEYWLARAWYVDSLGEVENGIT